MRVKATMKKKLKGGDNLRPRKSTIAEPGKKKLRFRTKGKRGGWWGKDHTGWYQKQNVLACEPKTKEKSSVDGGGGKK